MGWETQYTTSKGLILLFLKHHEVPAGCWHFTSDSQSELALVGEYLLLDADGCIRAYYQEPEVSVDCENLYVHYVHRLTEGGLERIDILKSDGCVETKRGIVIEDLVHVPLERVPVSVESSADRFIALDWTDKRRHRPTEAFRAEWKSSRSNS